MALIKFRELWRRAGYGTRMGSSDVLPPPPREFVRAYHLTTAEYALSNIALGRLKVARFRDLNDPFELLSLNFREKEVRKFVRAFKQETDSTTGLLCFSRNWTNPVLWSHYAARHTGICLGFNIPRHLALRVQYKPERLADRFPGVNPAAIPPELKRKLLCTKFGNWRYEGEYRVVVPLETAVPEGGLHFLRFGDDIELREVMLGAQCNLPLPEVREFVRQRYPDAITYKARLAFKFFEIVPDEASIVSLEVSERVRNELQAAAEKVHRLNLPELTRQPTGTGSNRWRPGAQ